MIAGAEWSGDPSLIWSHSWSVGWLFAGGLTRDGVKIDNYAMMPEVGGDLTGYSAGIHRKTRARRTPWAPASSVQPSVSPTAA